LGTSYEVGVDTLQDLLDQEADLANKLYAIHQRIKQLRGTTPPPCHGDDDCSTLMLSTCPWRIDCGE